MSSNNAKAILVGIAEMHISSDSDTVLTAPNLGSCLGIAVYDHQKKYGGMVHCLLPLSSADPVKAGERPSMYVDSGLSLLLEKMFSMGSNKSNLRICAAGGAAMGEDSSLFEIGKKNITILRKLLWKNSLLLASQDLGGNASRTVTLQIDNGEVWLKSQGNLTLMS